MAKKNISNEGPEIREEKPVKKVTRLRNADIVELISNLASALEKERNIRSVRENVIERENALILNHPITILRGLAVGFSHLTSSPKAQ